MTPLKIQQTFDLALQHHHVGRLYDAEKLYRQILTQEPNHSAALHNLATLAHMAGHIDAALDLIRRVIVLNPNNPEPYSNLGLALKDQRKFDAAITAFRQAIALRPNYPEAYLNLGITLHETAQFDLAIAAFSEAASLNPTWAQTHDCLANALLDVGQVDEAIAAYRRAIALNPRLAQVHGNLLHALHCHPAYDAATIAEEHRIWNRQHAEPLRKFARPSSTGSGQAHSNDRDPNRRLRVGYVSPDFRDHSVARFMMPLLSSHDRTAFEIFCYSQVGSPDEMTAKLRAASDNWRSIVGLSDEQAADVIREDQIDILIDVAGHTMDNRLLLFARKPAPLQVTYLGYPDTTGLGTMDYRLTDALADPPGLTDPFCSEKLIRLPRTAWCFQPPDSAPQPSPLPATQNNHITFGSFNHLSKLNPAAPALRLWAEILCAVPASKLFLKARGLNSTTAQQRIRQSMSNFGIAPDRLELSGWLSATDHLAAYGHIDIALDAYPYHGTTTTCEALWSGVPVITLAGQTHASRVGVSLLTNIGLPDLIAQTPAQYAQIATHLAADFSRLTELRSALRQRMQNSPLMDAKEFTRDIEDAYRRMWHAYIKSAAP